MGSAGENTTFDFIVVGGGASGCVVASRLANTPSAPSVLLLEAGGPNDSNDLLVPADRFNLAFTEAKMNWGYKTEPHNHLKGQQIDYSRGRGIGGSTAINFSCWVMGADEDFNEWARQVGDDAWTWENVKERMKKVTSYHVDIPKEHQKYIQPKQEDHGHKGPLNLSYATVWEKNIADVFEAAKEVGLGSNLDVNSGNPIGMGMGAACQYKGARTTANAYLINPPKNLTIITDSPAAKVTLDGNKATSIKTIDGREYHASKEIIMSAGALNSPQILLLSGIGDKAELDKHNIKQLHDLPQVGKNLQDHCFSPITILQKPGTNDRAAFAADEKNMAVAKEQLAKDGSGPLASLYCSTPMGWFKNDAVMQSQEFKDLPENVKAQLRKPTVPIFEIATHTPPLYLGDHAPGPEDCFLTALAFAQNPQSKGEVTLNSADPSDAPKINPNLLAHPFDRRVGIEALKRTMDLLEASVFTNSTVKKLFPKSRSEEDLWEHYSSTVMSSWHMCSTAKMGHSKDDAVVDKNFKVLGLENLRVVDLSVLPLLPNNHTQSTAYLVGETAAEKLIAEYGLARGKSSSRQSHL